MSFNPKDIITINGDCTGLFVLIMKVPWKTFHYSDDNSRLYFPPRLIINSTIHEIFFID